MKRINQSFGRLAGAATRLARNLQTSQSGKSYEVAILRGLYLALCSATLLLVMGAPAQAQSALTHHVRQAVISGQAQFLSPLPATQPLRLHIVLPLRNQAGLDKLLQDLYDPSIRSYRRFLTMSELSRLRRRRTDARHDPGTRHGSGAIKSGGVYRVQRYRNSQRHDDAQPAAHHNWLFVGLDFRGSKHA